MNVYTRFLNFLNHKSVSIFSAQTHLRDFAHARMLKCQCTYVTSRSHLCAFPLLRVCGVRGVLVDTPVNIIDGLRVLVLPQAIDRLVIGGGEHPSQEALRMREIRVAVLVEIRLRFRDLTEVKPVELLRDLRLTIVWERPFDLWPTALDTCRYRFRQTVHHSFLRHQRGEGHGLVLVRFLSPRYLLLVEPHARKPFP